MDPDSDVFGSPGDRSVIICTDPDLDSDPDPFINKQRYDTDPEPQK